MKFRSIDFCDTEVRPGWTADMAGIPSLAGTGKTAFFNLSMNDVGTSLLQPGLGIVTNMGGSDYRPSNFGPGEENFPDISTLGIPASQASFLLGAGILGELPNGVPISNIDPATWQALARRVVRYKPAGQFWDSLSELYGEGRSLFTVDNPEAFRTFHQWLGTAAKEIGSENFKDYAGDIWITAKGGFSDTTIRNAVRASVLEGNTCLSNIRQGGPLNHRNTPYFQPDAAPLSDGVARKAMPFYSSCLIQTYIDMGAVEQDPMKRLLEYAADIVLARVGLDTMGYPNVPIMSFSWPSNAQPGLNGPNTGYSIKTKRTLPNGDHFTNYNFPTFSYKWMVANVVLSFILCSRFTSWGDTLLYGYDESFVPELNGGNLYDGSNPKVRPVTTSHYSGTGERAFPRQNLFFDRALKDGMKIFLKMYNWSGGNFLPCSTKQSSQTTWGSSKKDNLVDGYERQDGVSFYSKTGNRASVFTIPTSFDEKSISHNLGGSDILTLDCVPLRPYATLIDLNA